MPLPPPGAIHKKRQYKRIGRRLRSLECFKLRRIFYRGHLSYISRILWKPPYSWKGVSPIYAARHEWIAFSHHKNKPMILCNPASGHKKETNSRKTATTAAVVQHRKYSQLLLRVIVCRGNLHKYFISSSRFPPTHPSITKNNPVSEQKCK